METLIIILLSVITTLGCGNVKNDSSMNIDNTDTCFSKANFDKVYKHVDAQIKNEDTSFYKYESYELYLTDSRTIAFKKSGYTLAIITKEKGATSLAKNSKDNDKLIIKANQMFCDILSGIKN